MQWSSATYQNALVEPLFARDAEPLRGMGCADSIEPLVLPRLGLPLRALSFTSLLGALWHGPLGAGVILDQVLFLIGSWLCRPNYDGCP